MSHPYRTASPPAVRQPHEPDDERWANVDVAVPLLVTLAASLAHVVWATCCDEIDTEYGLALGTAILCLALLRPLAADLLRGVYTRLRGNARDPGGDAQAFGSDRVS